MTLFYTYIQVEGLHLCATFAGYTHPLDACCGAGPTYPFGFNDTEYFCTNETASLYVCPNPDNFISWDGTHFTEHFNFQVLNQTLLHGSFIYTAAARGQLSSLNVSTSEVWA